MTRNVIPEACANIAYSIVSPKRDAFRDASSICKTRVTSVTVMEGPYDSMWLIPRSGASSNALNRVSSLTILGCRRPPPPFDFFFLQIYWKNAIFQCKKKGIIHSHRALNSVSSSTDKSNLLGPIPSRLRSAAPRVHASSCLKCWRKHFPELETSGTQFAGVDQHSHRWP